MRKEKDKFRLDIISEYRNAIYGFSIFYIVFFHANAIDKVDYSFGYDALKGLATFANNGNVGVDVFLFLSGVCLYYSYHRRPDVAAFIQKRLRRIFLPLLMIDGTYWFIRFILLDFDPAGFISRILTLKFWENGDTSIWYVSLILVCYLAYPYFYHYLFKDDDRMAICRRTVTGMLVLYAAIISYAKISGEQFSLTEIATTRVPVFFFGCAFGVLVFNKSEIPGVGKAFPIAGLLLFYYVLHNHFLQSYYKRFFFLIGGISLAYSLTLFFEILDRNRKGRSVLVRFFAWIGGFSLEWYLTHIMMNQVYRLTPIYQEGNFLRYLIYIVLGSLLLAYLTSLVERRILAFRN